MYLHSVKRSSTFQSWVKKDYFLIFPWKIISILSKEYVGWIHKYVNIYMCMYVCVFRYSHTSFWLHCFLWLWRLLVIYPNTVTVTTLHLCIGRKVKPLKKNPNKLGWQPEFDLYGTFQAWQPKLTLLAISCTKMVSVLSGSVVRFIGCETHFRWYFLSKQSHLKPMTTIFNDVIV